MNVLTAQVEISDHELYVFSVSPPIPADMAGNTVESFRRCLAVRRRRIEQDCIKRFRLVRLRRIWGAQSHLQM